MRIIIVLLLLALSSPSLAEVRLFASAEPVANQGVQARREAFRAALRSTLIKVTGQRSWTANPVLDEAFQNPDRWVVAYSYERIDDEQQLLVRFDDDSLRELVANAGLPWWGRERPDVLLWQALRIDGERRLIGLEERERLAPLFEAAEERGVSLVLPVLDLSERARVDVRDIWGGFSDSAVGASGDYGVGAVLVGRVFQENNSRWLGRYELSIGDRSRFINTEQFDTPELALAASAHALADELARRYAFQEALGGGQDSERIARLRIANVGGLKRHAQLERYLSDLSIVESLQLRQVDGDELLYDVQLSGPREQLGRSLSLGRVLAEEDGGLNMNTGQTLRYRMVE